MDNILLVSQRLGTMNEKLQGKGLPCAKPIIKTSSPQRVYDGTTTIVFKLCAQFTNKMRVGQIRELKTDLLSYNSVPKSKSQ